MPKLQSISPSNYQLLGEVEVSSPEEIVEKVRLAHRAKKDWAGLGVPGRVQLLQNLVEEFEARREEIILLESREMGLGSGRLRSRMSLRLLAAIVVVLGVDESGGECAGE